MTYIDHDTERERLTILYGDPTLAPPERIPLQAGSLSLLLTDGDLRYIHLGEIGFYGEVVRRIYGAVRDKHWGTVPGVLTWHERVVNDDHFRLVYTSRHTDVAQGIDFEWRGTLTGDVDGTITFDFDGVALTTFERNRIGLCVLHPANLAYDSVVALHSDGTEEADEFPGRIAPHQPFMDIVALTYGTVSDTEAAITIHFTGDTFETEDQRNWLDASFKTYSTPLALPFPVMVEAGTCIRQTVTLTLSEEAKEAMKEQESMDNSSSLAIVEKHSRSHAPAALFLNNCDGAPVSPPYDALLPPVKEAHPPSCGNFTEINRNRPPAREGAICYAANAQVHAFDSLSIMETPPMVGETVASARFPYTGLADKRPVHIGPLTLYGPYQKHDPRQQGLMGAAWYVAVYLEAAGTGAESVTLCAPVGPCGTMDGVGKPYPLYHALTELNAILALPCYIIPSTSYLHKFSFLGLEAEDRQTFIIVNTSVDEQEFSLYGPLQAKCMVRVLDETNAFAGFSEPERVEQEHGCYTLYLSAYAIAIAVFQPEANT